MREMSDNFNCLCVFHCEQFVSGESTAFHINWQKGKNLTDQSDVCIRQAVILQHTASVYTGFNQCKHSESLCAMALPSTLLLILEAGDLSHLSQCIQMAVGVW